MRLREIYREKLAMAERWIALQEGKTELVRMDFSVRSHECINDAEFVAHCIAAFGDIEVTTENLKRLKALAVGQALHGRNPWLLGLAIADEKLTRS